MTAPVLIYEEYLTYVLCWGFYWVEDKVIRNDYNLLHLLTTNKGTSCGRAQRALTYV